MHTNNGIGVLLPPEARPPALDILIEHTMVDNAEAVGFGEVGDLDDGHGGSSKDSRKSQVESV